MLIETKGMGEGSTPARMAYSLAGAVFLSTLGVGIFAFAIPLLALHDGLSGLMLGASFSGYFLAKLVISPVAGKLSDRTGPKSLLVAASILGLVAPMGALFSRQPAVLYAVQFCLGLSAGTLKPVATAAIAAVMPRHLHGRIFGLCNALYNAAFFLAPFMGGLIFYDRDLMPVLGVLAACMAASLTVILLVTPDGLSSLAAEPTPVERTGSGKRFQAGALLMAVGGRTACTACLIAFYPALLSENLHGPTWLVGILFALPSMVACLGLPMGGWLADRFNRESLTITGMAISAACLALAGRMETAQGFVFVGVILGLGSSISFPASMAQAASLGRQQGRILGWFHGAANAGFVVGPLLCGFLVERYAEIPTPMIIMGTMGLATVLPLALGRWIGSVAPARRIISSLILATCLLALTFIGVRGGGIEQTSEAALIPDTPLQFAGVAMGNVVRMTLYGVDAEQGGADSQAAFETISRLEPEFSHRNGSGSVGRVNMAAGESPAHVGKETFDLIKRALGISRTSTGVFDITIGAVTVLPYYYQEKAKLDKADLVDYRKVKLDEAGQTVFLPKEGMALDLGGLAKGTILDSAAATLRRQGVPAGLVEAGGDLYCFGDREWHVGVQNPRGDGLLGVISVTNAGVCGSGDYYQYAMVKENGKEKRKHHILDPDLLDSADESIAVTVVAPSAELADALATTLFIMGPSKGKALLEHYPGCSALWILPDQSMVPSKNFPPLANP